MICPASSPISAAVRAFCATASKRPIGRPDYLTPQQILEDPALQTLLSQCNLTPSSPINDPKVKLSFLSHLSDKCNVPVASDALPKMSTAHSIAEWYSGQLKPCRARPHARNLIRRTIGDGNVSKDMEDRIDLERDAVQEELEAKIPNNLILDERTFLKVDEKLVRKRRLPKPQLGRRKSWSRSKEMYS